MSARETLCRVCGALIVRVRRAGRARLYCTDRCRGRWQREHAATTPPAARGEQTRPTGTDYLARAEQELYPGRAYHGLTREERGAVSARAQRLVAHDKAAGVFVDPQAHQRHYETTWQRTRRERKAVA